MRNPLTRIEDPTLRSLSSLAKYAFIYLALAAIPNQGRATDAIPECIEVDHGIGLNNDQVIQWKTTTPNEWVARAHVTGPLVNVYPDKNGHESGYVVIDGRLFGYRGVPGQH
ncbi:MAG: hypothetical protein H7222_13885 [Methylotenera sp.]|nr:hypothetical protein [Oligoflexia bacterium]